MGRYKEKWDFTTDAARSSFRELKAASEDYLHGVLSSESQDKTGGLRLHAVACQSNTTKVLFRSRSAHSVLFRRNRHAYMDRTLTNNAQCVRFAKKRVDERACLF